MDFEEIVKKMQESLKNVPPAISITPEQDAARKAAYEAEQEDKRALLRGLRNQMMGDCERFNATYDINATATDTATTTPAPPTAPHCHTGMTTQTLIPKRETLRLTEIEWSALHAQAEYNMHSVAQYVSVIVRRHLQKDVATILKNSDTTTATKRPVGRPPAPKPPMSLQPWTPAIWEDELESWHTAAAERNPQHTPAHVRVAHDLYLETLFAHLQRVGYPHPFKAGFTAI